MDARIPVFDGHNDVLIRLDGGIDKFFRRGETRHVDLPRAHEGRLGGGFCAMFTTSPSHSPAEDRPPVDPDGVFREPFAPTPGLSIAQQRTIEVMARLFRIEAESAGKLKIVRTVTEIETCLHNDVFAALMHIEGAEAIDGDLNALEVFYQAGLRSIGLVWSRPNPFGEGVPFQFPATPDTGPGLTSLGKELVRACNRMRMVIDVSHLNEKGFWDVAGITDAPLVATHSNAWSLARSTRNLTDKQLEAIRESDGMVGINFAAAFLREDGAPIADTPLETVVQHVDYLVERLGIDRVGFGSDFEGAMIPAAIGDASGLPRLLDALYDAGYDEASIRKLAYENWVRVLRQTWGS